ncbi:hypothetical protein ABMB68_008601 [Bradyrhizobium sp. RT4a]
MAGSWSCMGPSLGCTRPHRSCRPLRAKYDKKGEHSTCVSQRREAGIGSTCQTSGYAHVWRPAIHKFTGEFMEPEDAPVQFVWQPHRAPAEFTAWSSREGSIPSREIRRISRDCNVRALSSRFDHRTESRLADNAEPFPVNIIASSSRYGPRSHRKNRDRQSSPRTTVRSSRTVTTKFNSVLGRQRPGGRAY